MINTAGLYMSLSLCLEYIHVAYHYCCGGCGQNYLLVFLILLKMIQRVSILACLPAYVYVHACIHTVHTYIRMQISLGQWFKALRLSTLQIKLKKPLLANPPN